MAKHIVISLIVEVSADIFRIKHGWKNVAMAYATLLLSGRFAQTGRAIRIRIQSVGYIYKRQANIIFFRSFLRQSANNQITVRMKRQALHNNKRTKSTYKIDGAAARLHARVLVQMNNIIGQKSGGAAAPLAPRLRGPCGDSWM